MRAGLSGNRHRDAVFSTVDSLAKLGVAYLGNGEWKLPAGATMEPLDGDNWALTMPDGKGYSVWSED